MKGDLAEDVWLHSGITMMIAPEHYHSLPHATHLEKVKSQHRAWRHLPVVLGLGGERQGFL